MRRSLGGRYGLLAVMVLLYACGGVAAAGTQGSGGAGSRGEPQVDETVTLTIKYSRFTPSQVTARPGTTVRFVVRNLDPIGHEFIIGDTAVHEHHEKGNEAHHGSVPGEVSVDANASADTTFTFASLPGRVVFGCHLPGHWLYGMRGAVSVAT